MAHDLVDRTDVEGLVRAFYSAAFTDPLIGPIFTDVAKMDLDRHVPVICDFWETVLFNANLYHRNALQVHLVLHARHPLHKEHFERWLELWTATVDAGFAGVKADLAKTQGMRMAGSMHRRTLGRSGSDFETLKQRS